jgi:hypothetical protein
VVSRDQFYMAGHPSPPTNLGEIQSDLLEIWILASRSSRNLSQNETRGTSSGRIIFKYFICQIFLRASFQTTCFSIPSLYPQYF